VVDLAKFFNSLAESGSIPISSDVGSLTTVINGRYERRVSDSRSGAVRERKFLYLSQFRFFLHTSSRRCFT
jgi:hypothetical protein